MPFPAFNHPHRGVRSGVALAYSRSLPLLCCVSCENARTECRVCKGTGIPEFRVFLCTLRGRYFTPKENGAFTALWFHVVPLDEHTTRVFNHAVIVQPMHPALKVHLLMRGKVSLGFHVTCAATQSSTVLHF